MISKTSEVEYKSVKFRSVLEARWAVFFDALSLPWEYEVEGFDLGEEGWYLPDFYLPDWGVWIEIRAEVPPLSEMKKFTIFHMQKSLQAAENAESKFRLRPAYVFCGTPGVPKLLFTQDGEYWKLDGGSIALHPIITKAAGEANETGLVPTKLSLPGEKGTSFFCSVEAFSFVSGRKELDIWPIYLQEIDNHPMLDRLREQFPSDKKNIHAYVCMEYPQGFMVRIYSGEGVTYDNLPLRAAYAAARSACF